jgi:hypothetical protein
MKSHLSGTRFKFLSFINHRDKFCSFLLYPARQVTEVSEYALCFIIVLDCLLNIDYMYLGMLSTFLRRVVFWLVL